MPEKYALVEHSSAINTIISNTFQTTHRIKFTAFDVSNKYIIFGANSGGIYIFTREPCQFLKLIPSTYGPTVLLQISPNQDNLAVTVSTGLVILLQGCFNPHFESQVFTEHEGQTVTAMRWNGDDLYCGDSTGRVSVITLKNFLTMFQTPVACLIHLDSQIVQLDTHSKFLLVSTNTRSVLCDTETERYRQIGKKMRDGAFGACFLDSNPPASCAHSSNRSWGPFKTLSDNEQLQPFVNEAVKIYCARPGVRLWQADFQANVVVTHQFRSSLTHKLSDIIQWDDSDELKVKTFESGPESFNFSKIFSVLGRFILAFEEDCFFIFEPSESALIHSCTHFRGIKDVKVVDSFLYLWHNDLEVSVLSLMSVEELILRSLIRKKYQLCGELCLRFYDHLRELLGTSRKIHLVSALENKLQDPEMLDKLREIFDVLREYAKAPSLDKVKNGIVTVNALPLPMLPESVQNFESDKDTTKETISILAKQFRVNKTHKDTETNDFIHLVESLDPGDFLQLIAKFQKENSDPGCDSWCKDIFIKHLKPGDFSKTVIDYACQAFLHVNQRDDLVCKCDFPLPQARNFSPKYFEIGSFLMDKSQVEFLKKVPSMYKHSLETIDPQDLHSKIPLLLQFGDEKLIEFHSSKITLDFWDESVRLLLKLKSGQCLNCGVSIDSGGSLEWSEFGLLMVHSIQAPNAIKLLKRYSKLIPKGEFDHFFYQYCIFSSVSTKCGQLRETLRDAEVQQQFESCVGGFLRHKYLRGGDCYDSPSHKLENCDHCQLPLKIPVLEEEKKLICGHRFHLVCFLHNQSRCFVCKPL